jgi:iron complex transport system substrate-binding protein
VHLLEGMLLELAEGRSGAPVQAEWLEIATGRLSASLDGELPDYAALAAELGMGETTLRRRFRKATGTSPHGYVLQCRLAEARRLLGETDLPVKSIAERLGYRDVYFFSRQFRQLAGVPPTVYRQSRQ